MEGPPRSIVILPHCIDEVGVCSLLLSVCFI